MYQRVPPEQPQSKEPAYELQDGPTEYLGPDPQGRESVRSKNNYSSISTSVLIDPPAEAPSAYVQDGKSAPATLKRSAFRQWFSPLFDALVSFIPLFFLGKLTNEEDVSIDANQMIILVIAALCLSLNGQVTSSYGENIKAITLVSPTIFPIVYAAILGKALRRIGLFHAERSVTIGVSSHGTLFCIAKLTIGRHWNSLWEASRSSQESSGNSVSAVSIS
jgi:hypothetical protein